MIAIITYDRPHRKTQDLIYRLMLNYYNNLKLVIIPWIKRKNFKPIYQHRPPTTIDAHYLIFYEMFDIGFDILEINELNDYFTQNKYEYILIGGAGLLPPMKHKIINSHPGYLPYVKGLDALKWAIYDRHPIGVTTHFISEKTDEGLMIERRKVPIYREDTFHSLAYRVYETEIEMLATSIKVQPSLEPLVHYIYNANKRMPNRLESVMMDRFEELRKKSDARPEEIL